MKNSRFLKLFRHNMYVYLTDIYTLYAYNNLEHFHQNNLGNARHYNNINNNIIVTNRHRQKNVHHRNTLLVKVRANT